MASSIESSALCKTARCDAPRVLHREHSEQEYPECLCPRSYLLKEDFQLFWGYRSPYWAGLLDRWYLRTIRFEDRADEARRPHVAGPSTAYPQRFS